MTDSPIQLPETPTEDLAVIKKEELAYLLSCRKTLELLEMPVYTALSPGMVIRIYRALRNIKTTKLADEAQVDRGQLGLIEKDEYEPQFETINNLANTLGSKFKELMLIVRSNKPPKKSKRT